MEQQIRDALQRRLSVVWIAAMICFVGFAPQLRADVEDAENNRNGWVQTNGPYGGEILTFYAVPKGVLFVLMVAKFIVRKMQENRGDLSIQQIWQVAVYLG